MTINSFRDFALDADILRALDGLGYDAPTHVQEKVIPHALEGRDLAVKSRTGSGKTAAFAIPLCQLADWGENKPQALILTPTRELAAQIKEDVTNIGRFKRIKATAVYGKSPFHRQKLELKQKSHVVAGTPGRVLDHIQKGTLALDRIKYLVIDEADEMLNMGFIDQVEAIIQELPEDRTTMVFSATLPADVEALCHRYMKDPLDIEAESTAQTGGKIEHMLYTVSDESKFRLLRDVTVVENPDSCIIFCRTKDRVDELFEWLDRLSYTVDKIHGGMVQEDRFAVMNEFKRGEFRYLVATDVAARGIDIDNISLVISYDLPLEKESYVHRAGRTGRAGRSGKAITFMEPAEERFREEIQNYTGFVIPESSPPSKEQVKAMQRAFSAKMEEEPVIKKDKSEALNQDIMKLYFNGGKKKKIRAVDFVGTIARIDGVEASDIGIITIEENVSYVEILNGKGPYVLKEMKQKTIKGKQLKVHEARK
ncbi:DEAD/DEAH box helicase [Bacillus mangrovi]|uniref:ATP-dependent RNA helicase DbpA n=1 Tax=Metabacillus mangrovi TaxID=1491830 RepID=A0A7X2S6R9_9BACI|nr:DEAD/DEAH box helicase [Metabacillus mangrovi]MTH54693.1 DEAD/DEAH box helicase [Metabacillus mangrovi]